jgi:tRNA-splicing ligase RtcB
MNIATFGPVDDRSLEQLKRCMAAGDADFGVLCADHHPCYSQPIGAGIAYEGYVSPSGVGYDIGCGNRAARTDVAAEDLDAIGGVEAVMPEIGRRISFGMGVPAQERADDHPVLDKIRTADFPPQRKLLQLAASQLGTVGSGNHYVNLMADEDDRVWVGVHFGSRGFGHKTASGFLAPAQGLPFDGRATEGVMDSPPVLFEVGSELGESYVAAMELAGEYAHAGRDPSWRGCSRSSVPLRRTRCTTTTTSRGGRSTSAAPTGSSARAAHPRGRVRRGSSARRWATSP